MSVIYLDIHSSEEKNLYPALFCLLHLTFSLGLGKFQNVQLFSFTLKGVFGGCQQVYEAA